MNIIIENELFKLSIGEDCIVQSLIYKPNGEECLEQNQDIALFSILEKRPFDNEIKLSHPNKRTVFQANRVRREGDKLIVGFETLRFEAVVKINVQSQYISFGLEDFIMYEADYALAMDLPPVEEFRILQLPIKEREHFGEWLNVCWDEKVAVNVLATSPYPRIDSERRKGYYVMYADAMKDIKLRGCEAALIVSSPDDLLDCIAKIEEDYDLPRGVESRRGEFINSSAYWSFDVNPTNVDEHIEMAKKLGFRMMLLYYRAVFKEEPVYQLCGNYDLNDEYVNGYNDLKDMLNKIKSAGIKPGIHFLHTHIGLKSRYVTPVADHRLNLTRHFTLAKPLSADDTTIYVEQNPQGSVMHEKCRILKFRGELIRYEGYSTEYPYCFTGCERGHKDTIATSHELGTIGGILDVSEFAAKSVYIDQNTSLQEEIAEKIAKAYNCGFEFVYFDGSEGTNAPYEFHISNAQHIVYKKLKPEPLFCEGAAKTHFGWHMLGGGNAFDVFPAKIFKSKLAQYPLEEAPRMAQDFTRLNFGWWKYNVDMQPDMYEYGMSRSVAWDCPVTLMEDKENFLTNPRTEDNIKIINRWETVRINKLLTQEQKDMLKDPHQEHILILNGDGEYELLPYEHIKTAVGGNELVSVFVFERKNKTYAVCWHTMDKCTLLLPVSTDKVLYEDEIDGNVIDVEKTENGILIAVEGRHYLSADISKSEMIEIFEKAIVIE